MDTQHEERRLTTILSADVVGCSRLMAADESCEAQFEGLPAIVALPQRKQGQSWERLMLRTAGSVLLGLVVFGVLNTSARAYRSGDEFQDCDNCPKMIAIPAGNFMMGSPTSEKGRQDDEGPQRQVRIAKPFAVGKFEVTFDEWEACVSDGGCNGYKPNDEGWGRGLRPVINVTWDDAKAYVAWLSRKTGQSYRLLSEAGWEYSARGGTTTPFSTGERITTDQANFNGNYTYNGSSKGGYRRNTVNVGSFSANAFGLHDMHGNVWEWVVDCYRHSYPGAPSDGSISTNGNCSLLGRVLRGGSWYSGPRNVRTAYRSRFAPSYRGSHIGFRVARTL